MNVLLYENAVQVVPLLLIALFLDTRGTDDAGLSMRVRRWMRFQDRAVVLLGTVVFLLSLLVVSGAVGPSRLLDAVVIATLGVAIGLLFSRIWRRFADPVA